MNDLDRPMILEDVHRTQIMLGKPFSAMSWLYCRGIHIIGKVGVLKLLFQHLDWVYLFIGNNGSQAILNAKAQIEVATATKPLS